MRDTDLGPAAPRSLADAMRMAGRNGNLGDVRLAVRRAMMARRANAARIGAGSGRVNGYGQQITDGLIRGLEDNAATIAPLVAPGMVSQQSASRLIEAVSDASGVTDAGLTPDTDGQRYAHEASRVLGGSIVPESLLAGLGRRAAARIAEGATEASLSRLERMGLEYVRRPGRVAAANVTGAVGSVAGGDLAAQVDERLRPVGNIAGGLLGGSAPFAGRPRAHAEEAPSPHTDVEDLGPVDAPETITPQHDVIPARPAPVDDPVAPHREQAFEEHAKANDLTRNEVAEMYYTNENPELTASVRDRANELYQRSQVEAPTADNVSDLDKARGTRFMRERGLSDDEIKDIHDQDISAVPQEIVDHVNEFDTDHLTDMMDRIHRGEAVTLEGERRLAKGITEPVNDNGVTEPETPAEGGRGGSDQPPEEPPVPPSGDGGGEPPHPSEPVIQRLTEALNSAGKVNKEQEALRNQERAQRVARAMSVRDKVDGEEGLHAELSALKGEMPKLDFEPVREQFTQEELKSVFNRIRDFPNLRFFEGVRARVGLAKLLDGQLPNASELSLLNRVFPPDFVKAALRNRSHSAKVLDVAGNVLNIPRALMSSVDLSAPLRQGVFLVGRKEFYKAWPTMFQQFAKGFKNDDAAFESFMDGIRNRPTYDLMDEAKLALGTLDHNLTTREEAFMSPYAERIPVVGRLVRASERAYTAYLNKLRADVFDSLVKLHDEAGINLETSPKELKDIASFINNATGRGNLGPLKQAGPLLNATFFSPRLIASRATMLNPAYYMTLSPIVRREAIKSLLSFGAIATTVLSLAAAAGLRVETDPRSSDFAKIRNGDVRYDILGGFGQYITLGARLATNQTKSLNGEVQTLGERYGSRTRLDTLGNFAVNKFAPVPSFVADYLRGKDPAGRPFNLGSAAIARLTPLFVQDIISVMQDKGPVGAIEALPGAFGVGLQVIPPSHAIDHLGRHVADLPEQETDPVALEVNRLTEPRSSLIGIPQRTNVLVGDIRRDLTDEEFVKYQETAGRFIHDDLAQEMAQPGWQTMPDDEKRDLIRAIVRDQRANARDQLVATPADEPLGDAPAGDSPASATGEDELLDEPLPDSSPREASGSGLISDARSAVLSVFPDAQPTSFRRDPHSRLGRRNPSSYHNTNNSRGAALDIRPMRNRTFNQYVEGLRRAGYRIVQALDEQAHPTFDTTGPNWHVVLAR